MRLSLSTAFVLVILTGCGTTTGPSVAPPSTSAIDSTPAPTSTALSAVATTSASTCPSVPTLPHQAPELEAVLPPIVAGRALVRWSVRGRCWLELAVGTQAHIEQVVAEFTTATNPSPIDSAQLVYGVDGRADASTDPPFFVYGAVRPVNEDEAGLAALLLFGGAGFNDAGAAGDLTHYEQRTIGGKPVYVGTLDMLHQDVHQRGRPYLYQTDQYMYLVITDDNLWAADAIRQLR